MKPCLVIPAFQPTDALVSLTDELQNLGAGRILLVDDGSRAETRPIFDDLGKKPNVEVLRHAANLGKGRALKTALNHYLLTREPESPGVVTLDADGQHLPGDVMRVAAAIEAEPGAMHLGVRGFNKDVPFRSMLGNQVTRYVFGFLTGLWVRDTQTGLRGIPAGLATDLLAVPGERYEYEIGMLLKSKERRIPIREHEIETVYIDANRGSHFNPLVDSMRIYFVLFRFLSSSMLTSLVDFIVFTTVFSTSGALGWSLVSGRAVASVVQFTVNRSFVFHSQASAVPALVKYYSLNVALGVVAYFLIDQARTYTGGNVLLLKVVVETLLFFTSYGIQSAFVFRSPPAQQATPN